MFRDDPAHSRRLPMASVKTPVSLIAVQVICMAAKTACLLADMLWTRLEHRARYPRQDKPERCPSRIL